MAWSSLNSTAILLGSWHPRGLETKSSPTHCRTQSYWVNKRVHKPKHCKTSTHESFYPSVKQDSRVRAKVTDVGDQEDTKAVSMLEDWGVKSLKARPKSRNKSEIVLARNKFLFSNDGVPETKKKQSTDTCGSSPLFAIAPRILKNQANSQKHNTETSKKTFQWNSLDAQIKQSTHPDGLSDQEVVLKNIMSRKLEPQLKDFTSDDGISASLQKYSKESFTKLIRSFSETRSKFPKVLDLAPLCSKLLTTICQENKVSHSHKASLESNNLPKKPEIGQKDTDWIDFYFKMHSHILKLDRRIKEAEKFTDEQTQKGDMMPHGIDLKIENVKMKISKLDTELAELPQMRTKLILQNKLSSVNSDILDGLFLKKSNKLKMYENRLEYLKVERKRQLKPGTQTEDPAVELHKLIKIRGSLLQELIGILSIVSKGEEVHAVNFTQPLTDMLVAFEQLGERSEDIVLWNRFDSEDKEFLAKMVALKREEKAGTAQKSTLSVPKPRPIDRKRRVSLLQLSSGHVASPSKKSAPKPIIIIPARPSNSELKAESYPDPKHSFGSLKKIEETLAAPSVPKAVRLSTVSKYKSLSELEHTLHVRQGSRKNLDEKLTKAKKESELIEMISNKIKSEYQQYCSMGIEIWEEQRVIMMKCVMLLGFASAKILFRQHFHANIQLILSKFEAKMEQRRLKSRAS